MTLQQEGGAKTLVKNKLRDVLIDTQKFDPLKDLLGWSLFEDWYPERKFVTHYPVKICLFQNNISTLTQ